MILTVFVKKISMNKFITKLLNDFSSNFLDNFSNFLAGKFLKSRVDKCIFNSYAPKTSHKDTFVAVNETK